MSEPVISELEASRAIQSRFAAHLRDPERNPPPEGIEERRLAIYRGLFYRNVEGFVRGAFPVIHAIIPEQQWHAMIRDFLARHRCQTPYFLEISQEFIHYLQHTREAHADDPPFLHELAHYEWVELALDVSEAEPDWSAIEPNGNLLEGAPVLSPVALSLAYRFPVHRIGEGFKPLEAPADPTYLLVYRGRDDEVRFMELNAVTSRLLEIIRCDETLSGEGALRQLVREMQHPEPAQVLGFGEQILCELQGRGVILGIRR